MPLKKIENNPSTENETQENNYPFSPPLFPDTLSPEGSQEDLTHTNPSPLPTPEISQSRTSRLRRQPVKDYRSYIPLSKLYPP